MQRPPFAAWTAAVLIPRWESVQLPFCIGLGLVPGLYALWSQHRLADHAVEVAFPERHFAAQRKVARMTGLVTLFGVLAGAGQWETVSFGSMILGLLVGNYPSRRTLWGESWSFPAYASSRLRGMVAQDGFWLFLGLGPLLALRLGGTTEVKTFLFVTIAIGWAALATTLFPVILGARPLEDESLLARLREIAARSPLAMPRVLRLGATGGTFANALALPDRHHPRVILGATLLEGLTPAETASVFAHELAHLEEFARRKGGRRGLSTYAVIVGASAVLFFANGTNHVTAAALLWLVLFAMIIARGRRGHRAKEMESDRRAVELCGDAETYASALIKIHALGRLPRRWAADFDRVASHPSLARRLAAIRSPGSSAQPPPPLVVTDRSGQGLMAVLDAEGCRWYANVQDDVSAETLPEAAPITRRAYEELVELRLHASGAEATTLVATDRDGQTWSVRLGPDDGLRVQAHLDHIDHRLAEPRPRPAPLEPPVIAPRRNDTTEWRSGGRRIFVIWLAVIVGIFALLQLVRLLAS